MCHKIRLFNFHFKVLIKYDNSKNSAKYHKILMSRFWEIVFCEPLHFSPPCLLSNLKHAPSREYPLTARKTVCERVPDAIVFFNPIILPWCRWSFPHAYFKIPHSGLQIRYGSRIPINSPWLGTLKLSVWNPQIIYFDHSRKMSSSLLIVVCRDDSIYKNTLSFF